MRSDFQERLIKILSGNLNFSKDEQAFFDEYFGQPLTEKQLYGLYMRYHIHLKPDEMGEGFERKQPILRNKPRGLPKSFKPLLEPLTSDRADLKKRWSLYMKFLWWVEFVKHTKVDENMWDIGEELLSLYPNGREAILIDIRESIKQRKIITKSIEEN